MKQLTLRLRTLPWLGGLTISGLFLLRRLHLPLIPFLLVLMLECLCRRSFSGTYEWFLEHPNEFWLNYWIALFLTLLLAGAAGRTRRTYAVLFTAFLLTGWFSGMKMNETGAPLLLWDLFIPNDRGADPMIAINPGITISLLWPAAAGLAAAGLTMLFRDVPLKWQERTLYGAASLFLLISVWLNEPIAFWNEFRITTFRYEQERSYDRNGFLVGTFDSIDFVRPEKPRGTGEKEIRRLVRSYKEKAEQRALALSTGAAGGTSTSTSSVSSGGVKVKPNVVVLLSETFWDPTLLKNVTFSEDPIPNFRALMESTTSGWMLTPQFGGTTANVEFEVLTGHSVRFLPTNSIAYIDYLNRGVDSLAGIFARDGYSTTAINPFFNWFFNSRNAYRNMGFSRFISSEFFEPRFHGPNYEDIQVMEKIIETMDSTPGPDFVFANTMENHGGYEDKFYYNPIKVTGNLSDKAKNILENYATGEQAFDKAFKALIDHYAASKEPTVILCFGDHLPALGHNYLAFKEAGYISGGDDPQFMEKMHYTPFVLWDNSGSGRKESLRMNASYLGPYLLDYIGQPGSYYTEFLHELYQKQPLIPIRPFRKDHPIDESMLAEYKRLEYDSLFGEQHGYKEAGISGKLVPATFTLGYGSPVLDSVKLTEDGRLEVLGDKFNDECTVWVNGRKLQTNDLSPHKLEARIPEGEAPAAFPWRVEVRLVDLKNTIIARSGERTLESEPSDITVPGASAAPGSSTEAAPSPSSS